MTPFKQRPCNCQLGPGSACNLVIICSSCTSLYPDAGARATSDETVAPPRAGPAPFAIISPWLSAVPLRGRCSVNICGVESSFLKWQWDNVAESPGTPRSAQPTALYSFPAAAVTNCHKLSGLKQYMFILFQRWGSEIQTGFHWDKSPYGQGCILLEALGKGSISSSFPVSRSCLHSLALGPSLHLQSQRHSIFKSLSLIFRPSSHLLLSL